MSMGRPVSKIDLSQEEFEKLQLIGRRPKSAQGMALRANIVLSCAQGKTNQAVAQGLGVSMNTVGKWRRRFAAERMAGLVDAPRSGAPREISDQKVEEVICVLELRLFRNLLCQIGGKQWLCNRPPS